MVGHVWEPNAGMLELKPEIQPRLVLPRMICSYTRPLSLRTKDWLDFYLIGSYDDAH
jgi:hypothetical protein